MPRDNGHDGTPQGVFGAELRYHRERAGLSRTDLAALVNVSHDVISKIETGDRPPAKDFPERLDAVPELDTRDGLPDRATGRDQACAAGNPGPGEPPRLWAVLDEGVLHRAISEPKVMHDQLMRVAEMSERPRMSIQVIPFTAGARTGLLGAFVIATLDGDGSTVYLETATTGQVVEVPSATREAALIFDNLRGEALPRTASRDLIMKEAQERWT